MARGLLYEMEIHTTVNTNHMSKIEHNNYRYVLCVLFKLKSDVSEVIDDLHWDTAGIVGAEGNHSGRF